MPASEILLNAVFYVLAAACVAGAVAVATSRNIVRSAFALLVVLFSVAGLYAVMKADFIAAAQVLIYVGGILVLIIFAVMLTHRITDVKLSNESTPGPAAFCACLCLLFSLVIVVRFTAKWRTDSDVVTVADKNFDIALRQYQADGMTGLAFGGIAIEESVVVSTEVLPASETSRAIEQVVFEVSPKPKEGEGKDKKADAKNVAPAPGSVQTKRVPYIAGTPSYRHTFDKLPVGDYHWRVKLQGREKDPQGVFQAREWSFPAAKSDFSVQKGVTKPIAMALAGPYLFAFEVVSVLLLAALVGAAFLARKEVRES